MKKNLNLLFFIAIISVFITSCGSTESKASDDSIDYSLAAIHSYFLDKTSTLIYMNENLDIVNTKKLEVSNIGEYDFKNPKNYGKMTYTRSEGKGYEKNDCAVIGINNKTGKITRYDFSEIIGLSDYEVTPKGVYVMGNYNFNTTICFYSFDTHEKEYYKIKDFAATDFFVCKDVLYILTLENTILKIDIKNKKNEVAFDFSKDFTEDDNAIMGAVYNDSYVYLPYDKKLIKLDLSNNSYSYVELPVDKNIWSCYIFNDKLYVGIVDEENLTEDGKIIEVDMENDTVLHTYKLDLLITEFVVQDDYLYLYDDNNVVYKYKMDGDKLDLICSHDLLNDGYNFVSGIFTK